MQFGCEFQYSLVMFYNPDPVTMASFIALAHMEQHVRGAQPGRTWSAGADAQGKLSYPGPLLQSGEPRLSRACPQDVGTARLIQ